MWIKAASTAFGLGLLSVAPVHAADPLSAIDWLSDSVAAPPHALPGSDSAVTHSAAPETVTVTPLGNTSLDAVGLVPPAVSGLPADFWGQSNSSDLVRLLMGGQVNTLPAMQDLLHTLLLAELDPPRDANGDGTLLLARLDKLLQLGALDQAQALLERAGPTRPALFRRWFDISLLTGQEDRACAAMRAAPDIAPTFPARIFCLARGGDWNAAALTLETGKALGYLSEEDDALLARFLDPELAEGMPPLPAPSRPNPLVFRMLEAIGEPLPTTRLPLAFAQADLRFTTGWKAQIEAAERLARSGAIPPERLLGVYSERLPAASGGIWDRVKALQKFDVALLSGDPKAVAATLPTAWQEMSNAELESPFAALYGERLARVALTGSARALAFRVGLLSDAYEAIATAHEPSNASEAFWKGLALGDVAGLTPLAPVAAAIRDGFSGPTTDPMLQALLRGDKLGEAVLETIDLIAQGASGDVADVARGLALLRQVGLEDSARRAGLELLLLERRG